MHPTNDRLLELLADHALEGISEQDVQQIRAEDQRLAREMDRVLAQPFHEFEQVAAVVGVSMLRSSDLREMPAHLRERLLESGQRWCETTTAHGAKAAGGLRMAQADTGALRDAAPRGTWRSAAPWLLVAASLTLAAIGWLRGGMTPAGGAGVRAEATAQRAALLAQADKVELQFADWDSPEVAGVRGDVVWSDAAQRGVLRLTNLPKLPDSERYQLWIVDSRGMEQRISGGVFNGGDGEVLIPVEPGIEVVGAAAFAITIERAQGVWVSDMTRRVVIAAKAG